jgi:hypothetical protein
VDSGVQLPVAVSVDAAFAVLLTLPATLVGLAYERRIGEDWPLRLPWHRAHGTT